jgi:hypothetical protein
MRLRPVLCLVTTAGTLIGLTVGVAGFHGVPTARASPSVAFAAGMSANHRYLVDQNGLPYMIVGDSPQAMMVNISTADADFYLADRQAHGFNAIWVNVLCDTYTAGRADGSTYDGIIPFTTPGDFSTPNPVYWARVDTMIQEAANHGITVFLDPAETGGWLGTIDSNGQAKDRAYGVFLGNRYKSSPNIVWQSGNDFQSWSNTTDDTNVLAIAKGIASVDPGHVQTSELNFLNSSSLDDPRWVGTATMNSAYTYWATYDQVLHSYAQTPTTPTYMVEANYEGENNLGGLPTTDETLRRQEWWTMTSGATGQLYGSVNWRFLSGWQNRLDTPAVAELSVMRSFFLSEPWSEFAPDASFITSGRGTYNGSGTQVLNSDYATATVTPDGAHAAVYIPTARTVTVNLSRLQADATARWVDPTTGTAQPATAPFSTPGSHADGASDWVLAFDAGGPPPTTTTTPGVTTTRPASTTTTVPTSTTAPGTTTTTTPGSGPKFMQVAAAVPPATQSSVAVALANPETAGDLNVVAIGWNDMVARVTSVTDTRGNTYRVAAHLKRGNGMSQSIWYSPHVGAGLDTVTVTFSTGALFVDVRLAEYGGVSSLGAARSATGNGGTASASVATRVSSSLVVGAAVCSNYIDGPGPGFSARIITQPNADILQDRVAATIGTYAASTTGAPGGWVAQAVVFH